MILIVSDIHFGRNVGLAERAKERDLLDLLKSYGNDLETLYLLGDVFDQYVEYRHLIPKGFERFKGCLTELSDAGIPIHYVVGNHDPWHLDYFETELGVSVARKPIALRRRGRSVLLGHGDEADHSRVSGTVRRFVRHPVSHALFRTLLPADFAYRLTRWTKATLASEDIDPRVVQRLEEHAARLLEEGEDVVILGHSHMAQCVAHGSGVYVNAGSWDLNRDFVTLDDHSIAVRRWNDGEVFVYPFVVAKDDRSTV